MGKRLLFVLVCMPCLAAGQPDLKAVLLNAGKAVERFWEQFSAINCTETVAQSRLDKEGRVISRKDSAHDYLVVMRMTGDGIAVEESRTSSSPSTGAQAGPLLVTSGFSTLLFVFHPYYQSSFEYSQPRQDQVDGVDALRIDFRQVHRARALSCLRLGGRDYPLEWSGAAWIEPRTWSVIRIAAKLGSGAEELGLKALDTEVRYAPVTFEGAAAAQWLPSVATIEAVTSHQHWKNVHGFSGYKHFTVETTTQVEIPK
jgi:hypothetical protein